MTRLGRRLRWYLWFGDDGLTWPGRRRMGRRYAQAIQRTPEEVAALRARRARLARRWREDA